MFKKTQIKSLVEVTLAEGERVMTENKNLIRGRGVLSFLSLFMVIFLTQTTIADEKKAEDSKEFKISKIVDKNVCEELDQEDVNKAPFKSIFTETDPAKLKAAIVAAFKKSEFQENPVLFAKSFLVAAKEFSKNTKEEINNETTDQMVSRINDAITAIDEDEKLNPIVVFGIHLKPKSKDSKELKEVSSKDAMLALFESLTSRVIPEIKDFKDVKDFTGHLKATFNKTTMAGLGLVAKCEKKEVVEVKDKEKENNDNTSKPQETQKPVIAPTPFTPASGNGEVQAPVCATPNPGTGNNFDAFKKYITDAVQSLAAKKQEDPFAALAQKLLNDEGKKDEGRKDDQGNGQQAQAQPQVTPPVTPNNDFQQPLTPQPSQTPAPQVAPAQIADALGTVPVANHHSTVDFAPVENGIGFIGNEINSVRNANKKADEALATTLNATTACKNQIALAQSRPGLGRVANSCLLNVTSMAEQMRIQWKGQAANFNSTADQKQAEANAVQAELSANPEAQLLLQSSQLMKQREDAVKALEKQLSDTKNITAQVAATGADASQIGAQEQRIQQALTQAKKDLEDSRSIIAKSEEVAGKKVKAGVARLAKLNADIKTLRDEASTLDSKAGLAQTKMSDAESQLYALTAPNGQQAQGPVSAKALLGGGSSRPGVGGGFAAARGAAAQPTTLGGERRL